MANIEKLDGKPIIKYPNVLPKSLGSEVSSFKKRSGNGPDKRNKISGIPKKTAKEDQFDPENLRFDHEPEYGPDA